MADPLGEPANGQAWSVSYHGDDADPEVPAALAPDVPGDVAWECDAQALTSLIAAFGGGVAWEWQGDEIALGSGAGPSEEEPAGAADIFHFASYDVDGRLLCVSRPLNGHADGSP